MDLTPLLESGESAQHSLTVTGQAGIVIGGHASSGPGRGGMLLGGVEAQVGWVKIYPASGGVRVGGGATIGTYTPAFVATVATSLPLITPDISATVDTIVAELPLITASITVKSNIVAQVNAALPVITAAMSGGVFSVQTELPLIAASITAFAGNAASIETTLPVLSASVVGYPGGFGYVDTELPVIAADIEGVGGGFIATVAAISSVVEASIEAAAGAPCTVATTLPLITAALDAGVGATGTISAALPTVIAAITVLAEATTQELVMVVGTHNNALSTYQDFEFNSFCELDGVYYGVGPAGLSQIDTGALDDDTFKISAGLSTGMMQFGEGHLKRISDAYMTLRTAGDLTLTITVDEGVPVILTMTAHEFATFIQRRVITPKGLVGKSWKFEINNVDGADFDFGQLGFNVAVSARRIRG